jgi:hypothetical protein
MSVCVTLPKQLIAVHGRSAARGDGCGRRAAAAKIVANRAPAGARWRRQVSGCGARDALPIHLPA